LKADVSGLGVDLLAQFDKAAFFEKKLGYSPDSWQRDALKSESPHVLLNCSRQSGKSLVASANACHEAIYVPGSLTLLLSPSLRQSTELFSKVRALYSEAGEPIGEPEKATMHELTLSHPGGRKSRVISLPGRDEATIRGYSGVSLLLIDEASRVSDELYKSVRPMLATSGGSLVALSTPFGRRGWWYEAWEKGDEWERFTVTAWDVPRIPHSFLEEERRNLGDWWFRQEYQCSFEESASQVFTSEDIAKLFDTPFEAWAV
jgi:Terminase large subunit, T4likevirus-type, N-terminal